MTGRERGGLNLLVLFVKKQLVEKQLMKITLPLDGEKAIVEIKTKKNQIDK